MAYRRRHAGTRKRLALAFVTALTALAGGCAGPLVVSAAQSRGNDVKFGYTRVGTGEQGIISCNVPEGGGDLDSCRHMTLNFQE
jgi:hypothetical protein